MVSPIDAKPVRPDLDGRIQGQYGGQPAALDPRIQNNMELQKLLEALNNRAGQPGQNGAAQTGQGPSNPVQALENQIGQFMNLADRDPTQLLNLLNDNPELAQALKQTMAEGPVEVKGITTT